jgi:uridine phosphorylase
METAIIYGLSDFLGHNAISLNAILANRVNNLYSKKPNEIIESLIRYTLKKI